MSIIPFDDLAALKIGDIIFECEGGVNIRTEILSEPVSGESDGRRTLKWDAKNTQDGEPIAYFVTEGFMHYGPRLYSEPQYCSVIRGTNPPEFVFLLLGDKP